MTKRLVVFELDAEEMADEGLTGGRYFWGWPHGRLTALGPFGPYTSETEAAAAIKQELEEV